ncbi:MAG: class I SAM-dependent methyltransferase [Ignavibacteriae bacterium]|nr:class I SAM-dependent methyltransferase [Ignavibacteriota bacterium]
MKYFKNYNINSNISTVDELPLWSAPFGLKLLDVIKMKPEMNVLDIGSGLGFPAIEIAMRLGNSGKVFGVEPWKEARERANEKIRLLGLNNIDIIDGVAEELHFENDFFDLVVSNNGINNVQDIVKSFKISMVQCMNFTRFLMKFLNKKEWILKFKK